MPGPESYNFPKLEGRPTDFHLETPRSQVIGETSRYDPNYYIPIGGLTAEEIQRSRAENQGVWMELGTAAANLIPNTALSIVESTAHLADLEDWSNMIQGNAANYGNVLTRWANRNKNVFGEVYRENPQEGFDITDSAWWISNGAGLVESVVAFGLTGYGVGSVLGKSASALSKSLNAYGKAKMGLDLAAQVGTSGALAFTEGAMTGAQVFESEFPRLKQLKAEELLNKGIKQYGAENITEEYLKYVDEQSNNYANQLAGESATKAVRINTAINTFLNLPETGALFRSMSANRYLDDALRRNKGENIDNYIERIKSFDVDKHLTREGIKSKVKQAGGEALEEMVNVYAEQEGRNVARKARGEDIVSLGDMLADDDIWAAGFWGAVGGSMQGFVMNKMPKSVVQEDGTTKWTTVGAYNKKQISQKYQEQLGDLTDRLTEFVTAKDNLIKASQTNDEKLYNESINTIFKYNSFNSIVKGVEEQLIDDYSRIMTLSPEEAAQQGFKGDYKQDAANKIQSIRENTTEWNKIQDRYMSQDLDLAGYPETIFQQFINVENNKKIIAEQEFEINKLQADINQSYALKGTDLTIAAYNDIVSSIRALDNDFQIETIDLENLLNLQTFDKKTQKRIIAKLNNKYGNLENAKTQIEKNLDNIREKANDLARTFKLQRENFDIQVDPENKLSQEEKDKMFAQILSENEFEIDALTEAKSQLQRNRETLRAQEEELRNLKSKDGVNKFKELKRQKLTEQNERIEQEVVEEQEQQAEAERQAQQEIVDDIRRRQEEEPETVTEEEVITLQQLEELEEQEGETYQEGQYTGEGSTPKELDKQYEDISDSANNSDEDGKVKDQQGNLIFVDDKLIYSFDKIAYASTVEYSEDETTGVIKHTSLELNPETNPDLLTTKFVAGTPIKIKKLEAPEFKPFTAPRKITFKDELGREVLVANKGETVTFEMLSHPYMQPIGIYDDSNNLIGMLHDVTYVRPERVLQQSLEEDRNNLIALRSKIGNDFIETTIVGKTNGHINQFRDGFRKLSELMPGPIEFAIATSSIQLNTSKTTIVDGLINKPKYKVGQVYAITYTPNGQKIAIPVKTTQVKEHPEVLNELLAAFDAFAEGKISQNQLKEVFSKYIYSTPTSEKLDAAGKNFKREADGKDRMYIDYDSLNVDGIVFGKSGDTKRFLSSRTPKEDIEKLRKIFISILSESYININFEKVRNENFVKNFTTSNVRFYKLPDGRVTVFDNPVISISTLFAPGIKPIEKTEEQPRVEPVSTDAKAELQKKLDEEIKDQKERLKKLTIGTPIGGKYNLKVGDRYDADVIDASVDPIDQQQDPNFDPDIAENDGAGYSVISKVYEYGEIKDGKTSKRATIQIYTFNTKAEADAFLEQKKFKDEKNKAKLGSNPVIDKLKEELATLEGESKIDVIADVETEIKEALKNLVLPSGTKPYEDTNRLYELEVSQESKNVADLLSEGKPLTFEFLSNNLGAIFTTNGFNVVTVSLNKGTGNIEISEENTVRAIIVNKNNNVDYDFEDRGKQLDIKNARAISQAEAKYQKYVKDIIDKYNKVQPIVNTKADIEKTVLGSFANTTERVVNSKGPSNGRTVRTELTSKISSDGEVIVFKSKNTFTDNGDSVISSPASMSIEEFKEHFYPMLTADEIEMFEETLEVYKENGWNGRIYFKELRVGSSKATNLKGQVNLDIMIGMGNDYGFTLTKRLTDAELAALEQPTVDIKGDIETEIKEALKNLVLPSGTKPYEDTNRLYELEVSQESKNVADLLSEGKPLTFEFFSNNLGAIFTTNGFNVVTVSLNKGTGNIEISEENTVRAIIVNKNNNVDYDFEDRGKQLDIKNARAISQAEAKYQKYVKDIINKYNKVQPTVEQPTIQPEETKSTFTSNNGLEFDIDFEDDVDLLPIVTDIEKSLSLQDKVNNLIQEGKITKFCK